MTLEATTTETEAQNTTEGEATSNPVDTTATAADTSGQPAVIEGQDDKPQGAPEQYEFKPAEGREFDPKVIEAYSEVAKELNLSQESAQKVIDKIGPELAAQQERVLAQARTQWVADTKVDKEIGGTALAENIALANKTFTEFGTPELRTLLETTGLGDHPEVIRWAHRVGKAISEDGFVSGKGNNVQTDPAKTMFPTMA